jgi:PilZ domain
MIRERRHNIRVEWHSPGKIYDGDGDWRCRCTINDLSNGGAKITGVTVSEIPDQFMLRIARGPTGTRKCRVLWRSADTLGVEFVDSLARADQRSSGRAERAMTRQAHA